MRGHTRRIGHRHSKAPLYFLCRQYILYLRWVLDKISPCPPPRQLGRRELVVRASERLKVVQLSISPLFAHLAHTSVRGK